MIDIHTHILFDVDDGAHSIEDSINMLTSASCIGIKHVVLTPHVSKYRPSKCSKDMMIKRYDQLKAVINERGMDIELYLGAEIDEHDDLIETVKSGANIHQSKYVLIDIVSSDAHDINTILSMKKAYDVVLKKKGKTYADRVFVDFPKQILENKYQIN
ncbi:hypothetical protein BK010_04435 [Tenericutes bacterium MO-XQ]|nr:hypothetical protein BK010_04435 [Tenericutes bacterium MO-XQ]